MQEALNAAHEAEAQQLAEAFAQVASAYFFQLAHTLVASGRSLFGQTNRPRRRDQGRWTMILLLLAEPPQPCFEMAWQGRPPSGGA